MWKKNGVMEVSWYDFELKWRKVNQSVARKRTWYSFYFQVSSGLGLPWGPCLGVYCQSKGLVAQVIDQLPGRSQG